jgi:hypothetical protein
MGASSYEEEINVDDIQEWFQETYEYDRNYYGSNPYSGSLATLRGVRVLADPFPEEPWTADKKRF